MSRVSWAGRPCARLRFAAALLAVAALVTGACSFSRPEVLPPPADTGPAPVYVAIGASETTGTGSDQPLRDGWPRALHRIAMPPGSVMVNMGVPGTTVAQAIAEQVDATLAARPNLVTVWLNVNDITRGVPVAEYEGQLERLVRSLRRSVTTRVLVANTPPLDQLPAYQAGRLLGLPGPDVVNQTVADYNAAIARVVQRTGALLIDLNAAGMATRAAGTEASLIARDGFHPNTAGHAAAGRSVRQGAARVRAARQRLTLSALDLSRRGVLVGTCSWTDATLVKETDWYPKKTMTAAERLAHYASRFPIVEVDSTYYFPPTPELAQMWADRTPPGFTMNIKAWSLLTGHPTFPNSLWEDMLPAVPPEHRDKRRLYPHYLPADALDEAFDRFRHALMPLHRAGRLGAVLLQYPRWFGPKAGNRQLLRDTVARLPDLRLCVEFRHARWLEGGDCESTLELLEELGVSFVCVDEPAGFPSSMPPVVAVTSDLAVVRFHGRNTATWEDPEITTAAERFRYRYTTEELQEWVPRVRELAASAREVHVLMNNCYRDDAVINAAEVADLLAGD